MDAWGLIIPGSIAGVVFELGHKYTNINVYKNAHLIYYYFDSGRFGFDFGAFSAIISITAPAAWVSLPECVQDPQSVNLPHPGRPPVSLTKAP